MRITVPHHTTREKARTIVEHKLGTVLSQFGHHAADAKHEWIGDTFRFKGKAMGFQISGDVEVTDMDVIIDAKLPLIALALEPKIKHTVQKEAEGMFRRA
jgi:hypothetical protein